MIEITDELFSSFIHFGFFHQRRESVSCVMITIVVIDTSCVLCARVTCMRRCKYFDRNCIWIHCKDREHIQRIHPKIESESQTARGSRLKTKLDWSAKRLLAASSKSTALHGIETRNVPLLWLTANEKSMQDSTNVQIVNRIFQHNRPAITSWCEKWRKKCSHTKYVLRIEKRFIRINSTRKKRWQMKSCQK